MGLVVCKLVRLGMDGDKFKKDVHIATVRKSVKIDAEEVKKFNAGWAVRGQLYVIDKEATAQREADLKEVAAEKARKSAEGAQADQVTKDAAARKAEAEARKAEAEAEKAEAEAEAAKAKLPQKPKTERELLIDEAKGLKIQHAKDATIAVLKGLIAEAKNDLN